MLQKKSNREIADHENDQPNVTRSIEDCKNLINEAKNMTPRYEGGEEKIDYEVCLCGELVKIIRNNRWNLDNCLEDDDDCKQHVKCLKKNIANKLNRTERDKETIYEFLEVFQLTMFKRFYGDELTEAEAETEKEYLYLLK